MLAKRLLRIGVAILALLFSTAGAHAGTIAAPGLTPDIVLASGDDLVLQGYETVILIVEDGILTGNDLTFSSGGSIDFWGPALLNPPYVPVTSVMGNSLSFFCTHSTPCGPFPGNLGFITVLLPTNVGNLLIEAGNQIIFKGTPSSSVPEPTTAMLLGGALVAFGIQRRTLRFR